LNILNQEISDLLIKTTDDLRIEYEPFLSKKTEIQNEQTELSKKFTIKEKIVEINVGGKVFITLKETLLKPQGTPFKLSRVFIISNI
jgi:hypothetical protein